MWFDVKCVQCRTCPKIKKYYENIKVSFYSRVRTHIHTNAYISFKQITGNWRKSEKKTRLSYVLNATHFQNIKQCTKNCRYRHSSVKEAQGSDHLRGFSLSLSFTLSHLIFISAVWYLLWCSAFFSKWIKETADVA